MKNLLESVFFFYSASSMYCIVKCICICVSAQLVNVIAIVFPVWALLLVFQGKYLAFSAVKCSTVFTSQPLGAFTCLKRATMRAVREDQSSVLQWAETHLKAERSWRFKGTILCEFLTTHDHFHIVIRYIYIHMFVICILLCLSVKI